jgi:hypothetical protein
MYSYLPNSSPSRLTLCCSSRHVHGIRTAKQTTNVFLIINIFRPVVDGTPINFGVYEPVPQAGKNNKSWEVTQQK